MTCTAPAGTFAPALHDALPISVSATATLGGTKASNYTVTNPVTTTAKITPAAVTVTFTAADKPYDGATTAAAWAGMIATGKVRPEDVTCAVPTGTFASTNASPGANTVTNASTLTATNANNY